MFRQGGSVVDDDEYAAWKLRQDGASWEAVAAELGCTPATAQMFASAYVKRTDSAADEIQGQLF